MKTIVTPAVQPVKRHVRRTTEDYTPPDAPSLTVEYEHKPGRRATGEHGYSLGSPPEGASVEIVAITTQDGHDIRPWLEAYGFDIDGLAERILDEQEDKIQSECDDIADRRRDEQIDRELEGGDA